MCSKPTSRPSYHRKAQKVRLKEQIYISLAKRRLFLRQQTKEVIKVWNWAGKDQLQETHKAYLWLVSLKRVTSFSSRDWSRADVLTSLSNAAISTGCRIKETRCKDEYPPGYMHVAILRTKLKRSSSPTFVTLRCLFCLINAINLYPCS